jgi:hypothetical protein
MFIQHYQDYSQLNSLFTLPLIKKFWSCSMYPQARTIYYRTFSKCILTKAVLFQYGIIASPVCSFCFQAEDNLQHFLVECPPKRKIWHRILSQYFPHLQFSSAMLYDSLRFLKHPEAVKTSHIYIPIVSTILWQLWIQYSLCQRELLTRPLSTSLQTYQNFYILQSLLIKDSHV